MTDEPQKQDVQETVDQALADAKASLDEVRQEADDAIGDDEMAAATRAASESFDQQHDTETVNAADRINLLGDVDLEVVIELGRTKMLVEDVLKLGKGSVVELDKLAGDPVDVYVNQQLVARGEVLVLNDNFCIRISEILADLEEHATAAAEQTVEVGSST